MNAFLTWLGWDMIHPLLFWSTPLGLLCTGTLVVTSFIRVTHRRKRQCFFDTCWHFLFGTSCAAGFVTGLNGTVPHHFIKTVIILIAIRGVIKTWELYRHV